MNYNEHGMTCLNLPGTQFDDLPGIISFNISNLINENGTDYMPYPEGVVRAAQIATNKKLEGSDAPNLLVQARAILLRMPVFAHMFEGREFDIADIVTTHYPKGVMFRNKRQKSDIRVSSDGIELMRSAFQKFNSFYADEIVEMVYSFELELRGLHLAELMLYSNEFKIDSIILGLSRMSLAEKVLRRRINIYMENQLMHMIERKSQNADTVRHVETFSLPLDIHERFAACKRFYNTYGGGAFLQKEILFAGSASGGMTFYDSLSDSFSQTISGFYEEYVK
jgi:hypothetical protein